jgi:hypothetical protein
MDAQCGMQELNMTFFYNWTIIPITDEDLRPFPEFAIYLQNEEPNSPVLVRSFRAVKFFSCNESRAIRFIALSQKFGDNHNPHALEYRGHYYQLSCDSYFGTTARPTTVATPVSITIPVSPALSQRTGGDYCYINELQSDFLGDSVIIPLTSKDLEKFPEYRAVIIQSGNNSRNWTNGYRLAGDFSDYQHQVYDFRNLSCRNISYENCRARLSPVVYEYDGRYHEVACLQDFGGAHRSREK